MALNLKVIVAGIALGLILCLVVITLVNAASGDWTLVAVESLIAAVVIGKRIV